MDSGSGSLQSSSGGDEEYDSHHHHHHQQQQQQQQQPQLFPPPPLFFNNNNNIIPPLSSSSSSIPHQQQQLPFHLSHHNNYQNQFHPATSFYDLPSNYNLQPPNFNPDSSNSFLNLDVVRPNPTTLRSDPTHFKNPPPVAAEGSTQNQIPNRSNPSSSSGVLHPKVSTKKRTRASRRAPTTVLTTDTTNFRAMVQEFTGIPSPPFTAGGSSYSRRFDLFGSVRTSSTATNLEGSGSGLIYSGSRSKVQLFSSLNDDNNVVEGQNLSNLQQVQAQAGIFSFQSLSGHDHLEPASHIHGSSSQQLLSALQNDETWRGNGGGTAATTAAAAAATRPNNNAGNCKLNFTGSSSSNNLQRDKEILLGNIISTRGENTVDSWICPSE